MPISAGFAATSATGNSFIHSFSPRATNDSLIVDSSGNNYHVSGTGLIKKIDSSGNLLWEKDWSMTPFSNGTALALNASEQLIVAGANIDTAYFIVLNPSTGSIVLNRQVSLGLVPFTNDGTVHVDSSSNIYIGVGYQPSAVMLSLVMKFNSSGVIQWSRTFTPTQGPASQSFPYGIGTDSSLNVYVGGSCDNADTLYDGYLIKLNSSGTLQWQRRFYGTSGGYPYLGGMSVDSSGNSYCGWKGLGNLIAKVNTSGTLQWLADSPSGSVWSVHVDATNMYYCFSSTGSVMIKVDANTGALVWQRKFRADTDSTAVAYGLETFEDNVRFSGYTGTSSSTNSTWIASFPKDGSELGGFNVDPAKSPWRYSTADFTYDLGVSDFWSFGTATSQTVASVTLSASTGSGTVSDTSSTIYTRRI